MIDLDPVYRMADEGEIRLMKSDVIQKVMEERFTERSLHLHGLWRATRRESRMTGSMHLC